MPNYNQPHPYYCGVDLHARSLFINICDPTGTTRFEKNLPATPAAFLDAIKPFPGVVVGCECMFPRSRTSCRIRGWCWGFTRVRGR